MTDLIHLPIDASALPSDAQNLLVALLDFLLSRGQDLLVQYLQVLQRWEQACVPVRALALKLLDNQLPNKQVARICGVSDRQLRRYPEYRRFALLLEQQSQELARGQKGSNGELEAWAD